MPLNPNLDINKFTFWPPLDTVSKLKILSIEAALIAKIIFVYVSNFMIPTNNVLNPDKTKNNENFGLIEAIIFFAA